MDATESERAAREAVLAIPIPDRAAIVVRGGDRVRWLNGLVTCDLTKVTEAAAGYGLIVEKKGRIQTDFFALAGPSDELVLAVPRDLTSAILETLDHYLIMEDAELEAVELSFWQLHGPKTGEVVQEIAAPFAGAIDLLGTGGAIVAAKATANEAFAARLAAAVEAAGGAVGDDAVWEALRIARGLPRFGVEVDTTLYPQEAALEKLAVSFDKGCYLGQEVVYMLENRGHVKRKLVPLDVDGDAPLAKGDAVTTLDGAAVGDVKSAVVASAGRSAAIAMVKWAQAKPGTELRVGDRAARVRASVP